MTTRNNTNIVTSMAQAIGTLIINDFNVHYEFSEYGSSLVIKAENGLFSLNEHDVTNITVTDLVKLAHKTIKQNGSTETQVVDFKAALELF
jgi:Holliday junction resolvasome RuvABC endonuclease subunit